MPNGSRNKSKPRKPDDDLSVGASSGNVFADLGVPHPEIALAKARLVRRIRDLIAARDLTQAKAAKLLGIDQPKVSALLRGRVAGYSLDRLLRFLTALGQEVQITVRPAATDIPGSLAVVA